MVLLNALAITAGVLRNAEMAVPAAVHGLWMYGTGLIMVHLGRGAMARSTMAGAEPIVRR